MVDRARLLDTFKRLVSIDSLSLGERQMADCLSAAMQKLGMSVKEDGAGVKLGGNAGNLHAFLPGALELPPLLFCCHMDTVTPGIGKKATVHEDGRITSDGSTILGADDLSGVAAILEAIQAMRESGKPHRPIEVLFTVAEEIYCRGIAQFDAAALKSKQCYVLDLTGPVGTAASCAPCILTFEVAIHGKPAHAGFAPEQGVHAIRAASAAISRMELGHVGDRMTVNVGMIDGGSARNIIPQRCVVKGEIRSFDQAQATAQLEEIFACFRDAAAELGASADTEYERVSAAYTVDEAHPSVLRHKAACEKLGLPFSFVPTHGLSDYNALYGHGLRGLVIANAMEKCHSTEEYTTADELERIASLVLELMTSRD